RRGVLLAVSGAPEFFSEQDLNFLEAIAHWMGIVIHRAELIERMKREAVEQGRHLATEELLTIMAHDLRNYLTPLKGRIELLERRASREGREQDIRDARIVNHTLGLFEQMIADLLDVAYLHQGIFAINAQPMKLMDLVQEVVSAYRTAERPIHFHTPVEVVFSADPERLRQLLENVLANAVKYAPEQTPIVVEEAIERRMDGLWMILTVSNQGPGLPPERLATFFHPFVAGSPSNRSGLGLYLANRIAAAHGGMLTIDSPAGQGAQITLALPVEEEELIIHNQEASDPLT
ncbi:MAG: ATP-binding protein, partial [Ktedonobacteraceae bacterium]